MNNIRIKSLQQDGIALPIALVFLLVTTLLGVSTLQTNLFGEKMTLNTIQRERALEAAEGTLIEGETFARDFALQIVAAAVAGSVPSSAAEDCTAIVQGQGGICVNVEATTAFKTSPAGSLDNWIDVTGHSKSINAWVTGSGKYRVASPALTNKYKLNTPPRYIVEFMSFVAQRDTTSNCIPAATSWPFCTLDRILFRITVLATAGNFDETRVMLQSTYVVDQ